MTLESKDPKMDAAASVRQCPALFWNGENLARPGEETSNALFEVLGDWEHQLKAVRHELPEVQP